MSLNEPTITMTGNLTGDPELRYTPSGQSVVNFSIACNPRKRSANGEWVDGETVFMRVVCWRYLAENVAESLRRGDSVIVAGKLQQRAWEDREGGKHRQDEILADAVGASLDNRIVRLIRVTRDAVESSQDAQETPQDAPQDSPQDAPQDAPQDSPRTARKQARK